MNASQSPHSAPEATAAPPVTRRGIKRLTSLEFKTIIGLLVLLLATVSLCGAVFYRIVSNATINARQKQAQYIASAMAGSLKYELSQARHLLGGELEYLAKTPDVRFVAVLDEQGDPLGVRQDQAALWDSYQNTTPLHGQIAAHETNIARPYSIAGRTGYAVIAPVLGDPSTGSGQRSELLGYLIVGVSDETAVAQLAYLRGMMLVTCMIVVVITLPLGALITRHITVPIHHLAQAAHTFAAGDQSVRAQVNRVDELGALAEAFNTMAATVQRQQADILQHNAGLEAAVHERTAELERLNGRLKAEIAEKEDFLRAVSHDLNAPLRNIAGMASMLLIKYQSTLEQDAVQRLERIQKNVEVESELIGELLELSRIKSRREKIESVDLHELVQSIGDQLSNDLETRGINLRLMSHLPVMRGERSRLRQAFQNLIDNAIKYMRDDGPREIRVGMRQEENEYVLYVQDDGMGIAPEDMGQLFHIFRRAKNAAMRKIPGKGVGLASVKSIVENYHGRLWAESTPGEGTTFYIAIPKACFPAQEEAIAT